MELTRTQSPVLGEIPAAPRVRSVAAVAEDANRARPTGTTPIEDYAIIGNCHTAALVSRGGSIDFLCWPRFDGLAMFAALLDPSVGGSWSVAPMAPAEVSRRYRDGTAILETTFRTSTGEVLLTDAMPVTSPEDAMKILSPENEIVRVVTCTHGEVEVAVTFDPRPGFGKNDAKLIDRGKLGIRVETATGLLTFRTDVPMVIDPTRGAHGRFVLREGESAFFSLTFTYDAPAVIPPLGDWTLEAIARTEGVWRAWSARTTYEGPYRDLVVRSAITVKMLAYAPSGAIVAAVTTSLPETLGGPHNWDYRYCWLRDASFTVRGMIALGHPEEAEGFTSWLLHTTRLTQPKLMVLYDVFGRLPGKEKVLAHLAGYGASRPVRVGNGADTQLQLDVYGEVLDAVWRIACADIALDRDTKQTILALGKFVCEHWDAADDGIWEPRSGKKRHTHSHVLCWVALERLLDLQRRGVVPMKHHALFQKHHQRIREVVEARGYSKSSDSYTSAFDEEPVDATSLLLGWYGFEEPSSPRMKSTFARIRKELSPGPGLLYRYDPSESNEGAFGICSFWLAEHLARGGGTIEEATRELDATVGYANDVGLFAEEIDALTGRALGNFPQTFTHVGLINAALSLEERRRKEPTP